ncbi:MAG: hypothetical protein KDA96_00305, partial [Planctomycetaceae bacterium]|nr:hypothetical protein [Planctomycetaceae bacterium]
MMDNVLEKRVISDFSDALSEDNEAALRFATSTRFEHKALRSDDAFGDLEIIDLPDGKLKIVKTEEIDASTRNVIVEDESEEKYQIRIVKDDAKGRWVVDDVFFRQQKRGTRVTKAATEVLDLVLSIREFLDTWQSEDRTAIMASASSDLRPVLEKVPDAWLAELSHRITSEYDESAKARTPEVQLNENDAVVQLPATHGSMLMKIVKEDDIWRVADIEIRNRREEGHPGSLLRQADAAVCVSEFLRAWRLNNNAALESVASPSLFNGTLSIADLSLVAMPDADDKSSNFSMESYVGKMTVLVPSDTSIVRFDLEERPPLKRTSARRETADLDDLREGPTSFLVGNVLLYDRSSGQQQSLTTIFTAPARASIFLSLLQEGDLPMLQQLSSIRLNKAVWDRMSPPTLSMIPMDNVPSGEFRVLQSRMRGLGAELEMQSDSGQVVAVTLVDENGTLKVDNIEYPDLAMSTVSFSERMELMIPVVEFAAAWGRRDLEQVRRASSTQFNRLVWSNMATLPENMSTLPTVLLAPVTSSRIQGEAAIVVLRNSAGQAARVQLVAERDLWMVDEVSVSNEAGLAMDVRSSLRQKIAETILQQTPGVIQASSVQRATSEENFGGSINRRHGRVIRADGSAIDQLEGGSLVPSPGRSAVRNDVVIPGLESSSSALAPGLSPGKSGSDNSGSNNAGFGSSVRRFDGAPAPAPVDMTPALPVNSPAENQSQRQTPQNYEMAARHSPGIDMTAAVPPGIPGRPHSSPSGTGQNETTPRPTRAALEHAAPVKRERGVLFFGGADAR